MLWLLAALVGVIDHWATLVVAILAYIGGCHVGSS